MLNVEDDSDSEPPPPIPDSWTVSYRDHEDTMGEDNYEEEPQVEGGEGSETPQQAPFSDDDIDAPPAAPDPPGQEEPEPEIDEWTSFPKKNKKNVKKEARNSKKGKNKSVEDTTEHEETPAPVELVAEVVKPKGKKGKKEKKNQPILFEDTPADTEDAPEPAAITEDDFKPAKGKKGRKEKKKEMVVVVVADDTIVDIDESPESVEAAEEDFKPAKGKKGKNQKGKDKNAQKAVGKKGKKSVMADETPAEPTPPPSDREALSSAENPDDTEALDESTILTPPPELAESGDATESKEEPTITEEEKPSPTEEEAPVPVATPEPAVDDAPTAEVCNLNPHDYHVIKYSLIVLIGRGYLG